MGRAWQPLVAAGAAATFTVAAVAYAAADNVASNFAPQSPSLMPAMWAAVFGAGFCAAAPLLFPLPTAGSGSPPVPRWTALQVAAAALLAGAAPVFLVTALAGLIAVRDAHGAVWAALALAATVGVADGLFVAPAARRQLRGTAASAAASNGGLAGKRADHHDDDGGESGGQAASLVPAADAPAAPQPPRRSCPRRAGACLLACGAWTAWALTVVVLVGYGVQWPLRAAEVAAYPPPGRVLQVPVYDTSLPGGATPPAFPAGSPASPGMTHGVHLYCTGTASPAGRPRIVFEAGGGTSGLSFLALQNALAARGWRSCAVDRSGYGYSDSVPLGGTSAVDNRRKLAAALTAAGETAAPPGGGPTPLILAGHSAGVELVQVFAAGAANSPLAGSGDAANTVGPAAAGFAVVGLALLDGYPDYRRLQGGGAAAVAADNDRVCGALQAARAFEAVGLIRAVTGASAAGFQPTDAAARYAAAYGSGHAWRAQYVDFCTSAGGGSASAGNLLQAAAAALGVPAYDPAIGVAWPPAPAGAPVLVMPASATVGGDGGAPGNVYWAQSLAYNATLAPAGNATVAVCPGCSHDFPWARADWAAATMDAWFGAKLGYA